MEQCKQLSTRARARASTKILHSTRSQHLHRHSSDNRHHNNAPIVDKWPGPDRARNDTAFKKARGGTRTRYKVSVGTPSPFQFHFECTLYRDGPRRYMREQDRDNGGVARRRRGGDIEECFGCLQYRAHFFGGVGAQSVSG
ncbi:hypothetical protein MTO96_048321 [Rhipicephalus appendiculatus]